MRFEELMNEVVRKKEILGVESDDNFLVGAEFEFYHRQDDDDKLRDTLTAIVPKGLDDGWETDLDYSLGAFEPEAVPRELKTPPMKPSDFFSIAPKVLEMIDLIGWTSNKCGLHVTVSYNAPGIGPNSNINHTALHRSLEDPRIYKSMPSRQNNKYAASSEKMAIDGTAINPYHKYQSARIRTDYDSAYGDTEAMSQQDMKELGWTQADIEAERVPLNNRVEFRAMGGADYQKKWPEIRRIVLGYMHKLKQSLTNKDFMRRKIAKDAVKRGAPVPPAPELANNRASVV